MIPFSQVHVSLDNTGLHLQYHSDVLNRHTMRQKHLHTLIVTNVLTNACRSVTRLACDVSFVLSRFVESDDLCLVCRPHTLIEIVTLIEKLDRDHTIL